MDKRKRQPLDRGSQRRHHLRPGRRQRVPRLAPAGPRSAYPVGLAIGAAATASPTGGGDFEVGSGAGWAAVLKPAARTKRYTSAST